MKKFVGGSLIVPELAGIYVSELVMWLNESISVSLLHLTTNTTKSTQFDP